MTRNKVVGYLMLAVFTVLAGSALAGITGTKHDFTGSGNPAGKGFNKTTDMCGPCHVPHRPTQNVPLWAHTLSTKTFQLYDDNATYTSGHGAAYDVSPIDFAGSKTRACMSCHDGTLASVTGVTLAAADASWILWDAGAGVPAATSPQTGFKGSHPIAVTYSSAWAGYKDISADPNVKLEAGKVQCTSCHEAHDNTNTYFLVRSNTNSGLCLVCHNK